MKPKKIKFKVLLVYYEGNSQMILRSKDTASREYVPAHVRHNRVSLSKAFREFKEGATLEITIAEVKQ